MLRRASAAVAVTAGLALTLPGFLLPLQPEPLSSHERLSTNVMKHTSRRARSMRWSTSAGREVVASYDAYVPLSGAAAPGPIVFIAPPSFVSSRTSWLPLVAAMRPRCDRPMLLLELPGYGQNSTAPERELAPAEITPAEYRVFLRQFLAHVGERYGAAPAVVASGHAATYALELGAESPELVERLMLANPTWRGPLATVQHDIGGGSGGEWVAGRAVGLLRSTLWAAHQVPLLGHSLHYLGTRESSIRKQLHSHVFVDTAFVTDAVVRRNYAFAREGNISGKWAFLTGVADSFASREEYSAMLDAAHAGGAAGRHVLPPTLVTMAKAAPATSVADLAPLAGRPGVRIVKTEGALRSFVEFPEEAARLALNFLAAEHVV